MLCDQQGESERSGESRKRCTGTLPHAPQVTSRGVLRANSSSAMPPRSGCSKKGCLTATSQMQRYQSCRAQIAPPVPCGNSSMQPSRSRHITSPPKRHARCLEGTVGPVHTYTHPHHLGRCTLLNTAVVSPPCFSIRMSLQIEDNTKIVVRMLVSKQLLKATGHYKLHVRPSHLVG